MVEAAVCLANEMVDGADRLREDALTYATMRMQFGKPIASFQSMKHKQADMLLEVELGESAAYYAAASLDDGDDDAVANAKHLSTTWRGSPQTIADFEVRVRTLISEPNRSTAVGPAQVTPSTSRAAISAVRRPSQSP